MIPSMWMRWVHATFDPHLVRATSPAQICVKCVLKIWSDYCEVESGTKEVYKEATIFSNLFTEKVAYISFSWGLWISMGVQSKETRYERNHSLWPVRIQGQFGDNEKLLALFLWNWMLQTSYCNWTVRTRLD